MKSWPRALLAAANQFPTMRFKVIMEAAPSALICVLQHVQAHNLVPKTVEAHRLGNKFIEIKIELDGLTHDSFRQMLAKIDELPMVVAAVPFDVNWTHTGTCA